MDEDCENGQLINFLPKAAHRTVFLRQTLSQSFDAYKWIAVSLVLALSPLSSSPLPLVPQRITLWELEAVDECLRECVFRSVEDRALPGGYI